MRSDGQAERNEVILPVEKDEVLVDRDQKLTNPWKQMKSCGDSDP